MAKGKYQWDCKIELQGGNVLSKRINYPVIHMEDPLFDHLDVTSARLRKYIDILEIKTVFEFLKIGEHVWLNLPKFGVRSFAELTRRREELIDKLLQQNTWMVWLKQKEVPLFTS